MDNIINSLKDETDNTVNDVKKEINLIVRCLVNIWNAIKSFFTAIKNIFKKGDKIDGKGK